MDGEDPSAPQHPRESILYLSDTYRLVSEICMLVGVGMRLFTMPPYGFGDGQLWHRRVGYSTPLLLRPTPPPAYWPRSEHGALSPSPSPALKRLSLKSLAHTTTTGDWPCPESARSVTFKVSSSSAASTLVLALVTQ